MSTTDTAPKKRRKRATMHDVANQAGVAISTVSHVLNDTAKITDETSRRVLDAIAELNYIPNNLARELRQHKTSLIGVIVPDLSNEFYAQATSGIMQAARKEKNTILVCNTGYDLDREIMEVETLTRQRVDGLIFLGGTNDEVIHIAKKANIPVVLGDRSIEGVCCVEYDNARVVGELIHTLYDQGIRRIGFIGEPLNMVNLRDRHDGMIKAMEELHLEIRPDWILFDQRLQLEKIGTAGVLMREILAQHSLEQMPQVFLTSSDLIAIGIMDALRKGGYKVPQDVGVIGFDDIVIARYHNPPLTTIRQDTFLLGSTCFKLLQKVIADENYYQRVNLDAKVILRESVRI